MIPETAYWLPVAHELISEHQEILTPDWCDTTLAIWLRDRGHCVYCGFDLLRDRNFAYHFSCLDHVLPRSKYPALEHDLGNQVLACGSCNRVKRQWDPNEAGDVCDGKQPLTDDQRRLLVTRVIAYLRQWADARNVKFEQERRLIAGALKVQRGGG